MLLRLFKLSSPGWVKEFADEAALTAELERHICGSCLTDNGRDLNGMLSSCCGCEFMVDDPIEQPMTDAEHLEEVLRRQG